MPVQEGFEGGFSEMIRASDPFSVSEFFFMRD
jgi:hypothetical protein